MGKWTRRAVIATGGLVGGTLLVGVGVVALAPNRLALRPDAQGGQLATWVRITPTGDVVAIVPHADLGQGTHTALAMMLAEELDADWSRVRVEEAPATDDYANGHVLRGFFGGALQLPRMLDRGADWSAFKLTQLLDFQITGGSVSVRGTGWYGMRIAGAAARDMLLRAAAARWSVPVAELSTADSRVSHTASGRSAGYEELIEAAIQLEPPQRPALKAPADYRIVGTPRHRLDVPAKVDGTAVYAVDVRLPDMLHAALMAAPVFGGRLESVDSATAMARAGVKRVVELEQAVAVVAETHWQAQTSGRPAMSRSRAQPGLTSSNRRCAPSAAITIIPLVMSTPPSWKARDASRPITACLIFITRPWNRCARPCASRMGAQRSGPACRIRCRRGGVLQKSAASTRSASRYITTRAAAASGAACRSKATTLSKPPALPWRWLQRRSS